jgi:hypothetical protein
MALLDVPVPPHHPRKEEQKKSHTTAKNNIGAADRDAPVGVVPVCCELKKKDRNEDACKENENFQQIEWTWPQIVIDDSM